MEKKLIQQKDSINIVVILLIAIYLAPLFSIFLDSSFVISTIILGISLIIWRHEEFYYILPIFIFFYGELVLPGGIALFRIYSILLFFKIIVSKNFKIEVSKLFPLLIIALYCVSVISYYEVRLAFFVLFDIFLIIIFISSILKKNIKLFFSYYVYGSVISCLYGWINQGLNINAYIQIDNQWIGVSRFVGSLIDPNYFGFFLNIAIFAVFILDIIKIKKIKIILIIFLYSSLLATLSITCYLCNILILLLYLVLRKNQNIKNLSLLIILGVSALSSLNLLKDSNIPIIGPMAKRINDLWSIIPNKDYDALTTKRSSIWREHLEYYFDQPLSRILFGGNYVTDFGLDSKFENVSHQAYIDMLLNFGILGTLCMVAFLFIVTIYYLMEYYKTKKEEYLLLVIIKGIWIFYAFGLSMFPSWAFNLFFLL